MIAGEHFCSRRLPAIDRSLLARLSLLTRRTIDNLRVIGKPEAIRREPPAKDHQGDSPEVFTRQMGSSLPAVRDVS